MITLFTLPKPFVGHIDVIQRNAIGSWTRLDPQIQVVLFGNEEGTREAVSDLRVEWIPNVEANEFGTPLVSGAFASAEQIASYDVLCFANADIILLPELINAINIVAADPRGFMIVGQCWNLRQAELLRFEAGWQGDLRSRALAADDLRFARSMDFFVFRRGTIGKLPQFAVGRPYWDTWLIWRARKLRMKVVNVTPSVLAIHQDHDYAHVKKPAGWRWMGPEGDANRRLLKPGVEGWSVNNATYELTDKGLVSNRRRGSVHLRLRVDSLLLHTWTSPFYVALQSARRWLRDHRKR